MDHSIQTIVITICGIPGAGKTTLAGEIQRLFPDVPIISTDLVKARSIVEGSHDPWIHTVSHEAWKLLGEQSKENIILGFRRHAQAVMSPVLPLLQHLQKKHRLMIVEGIHILPETLSLSHYRHVPIFLTSQFILSSWEKKTVLRKTENIWKANIDILNILEDYLSKIHRGAPTLTYTLSSTSDLKSRVVNDIFKHITTIL